MMIDTCALRSEVLERLGAPDAVRKELLAYNDNRFEQSRLHFPLALPPDSGPHLAAWQLYADEAKRVGTYAAWQQHLVQLRFPIRENISLTDASRAATRTGAPVAAMPEASGLILSHPEQLRLVIYQSLAGAIPALLLGSRADFVALVQALTKHNEPHPVPDALGALMVAGLNNWDRICRYRRQWEAGKSSDTSETSWRSHFSRYVVPRKELYQDRVLLVSSGWYSDVPAGRIGLDEETWRDTSVIIRLAHESTRYFTSRLLGSMRNRLLDEIIADYMGIVAAEGQYRSDWFLRFLGLEAFPAYREGGRLQNYRGEPQLSAGAFRVLQRLAKVAAENLEQFDRAQAETLRRPEGRARMLLALTRLTVAEMASGQAQDLLHRAFDTAGEITISKRVPCYQIDRTI